MPTDSELRDAAETLLIEQGESCEHIWNAHRCCQWCHREQKTIFADLVARAYLAQRADDGELIDAAFLESVGFIKCCTSKANPALDAQGFEDWTITFDSGDGVDLRIYNNRELTTDCWINNAGLAAGPQTRGQLRQLLSALGVNREGDAR